MLGTARAAAPQCDIPGAGPNSSVRLHPDSTQPAQGVLEDPGDGIATAGESTRKGCLELAPRQAATRSLQCSGACSCPRWGHAASWVPRTQGGFPAMLREEPRAPAAPGASTPRASAGMRSRSIPQRPEGTFDPAAPRGIPGVAPQSQGGSRLREGPHAPGCSPPVPQPPAPLAAPLSIPPDSVPSRLLGAAPTGVGQLWDPCPTMGSRQKRSSLPLSQQRDTARCTSRCPR